MQNILNCGFIFLSVFSPKFLQYLIVSSTTYVLPFRLKAFRDTDFLINYVHAVSSTMRPRLVFKWQQNKNEW